MDTPEFFRQRNEAETKVWHQGCWGRAFMPLRKPDDTVEREEPATVSGGKFPPEADAYDTDVTEKVVKNVQKQADKILAGDEWVVIDGVDGR